MFQVSLSFQKSFRNFLTNANSFAKSRMPSCTMEAARVQKSSKNTPLNNARI